MSKFLTISLFTLTFSFVAQATPSYWAAAETAAATTDKSGGAYASSYSGYYCTVATAESLFGSGKGSISAMTTYLAGNFDSAQTALSTESAKYSGGAGAAGQLKDISYAMGQYELSATYGNALVGSTYLAMLFYENGDDRQIRVMMNDASGTDMAQGNVAFNDNPSATAGTAGDWTKAVPEPTSGLLLLLGVAGLALKRKRA